MLVLLDLMLLNVSHLFDFLLQVRLRFRGCFDMTSSGRRKVRIQVLQLLLKIIFISVVYIVIHHNRILFPLKLSQALMDVELFLTLVQ